MSDFLTRVAQRQRGELPTVQPRILSVFAPAADRQNAPMPEAAAAPPPSDARKPEPVITEKPSRRTLPLEQAEPGVHTLLVPVVGRLEGEQRPAAWRVSENATGPPVREVPPAVMQPSPAHQPLPERAVAPQRQAAKSEPLSAVMMPASPRVRTERLTQPVRVELPPRLVREKTGSHGDRNSAPPSLVAAAVAGKQSEAIAPDASEPPVQVTIGRIEVTAVTALPAPKRTRAPHKPSMSLQDYLSQRRGRIG